MPKSDIVYLIILTLVYLSLFGIAELILIKFKVNAENTRKFVHISCGLVSLLYVILFQTIWPVIIITVSFAILLYTSKKYKFLNSIHGIKRESFGSYLFPITILFCFSVYLYMDNPIFYYLPFIIMVLSDPIAAIVGKRWPVKKYKSGKDFKSIGGSSAFFITASVISFFLIQSFYNMESLRLFLYAMAIGLISSITEGISRNGVDNFFIPFSVVLMLYVLV